VHSCIQTMFVLRETDNASTFVRGLDGFLVFGGLSWYSPVIPMAPEVFHKVLYFLMTGRWFSNALPRFEWLSISTQTDYCFFGVWFSASFRKVSSGSKLILAVFVEPPWKSQKEGKEVPGKTQGVERALSGP
jgi:hypothetical protein